jgi:hypothetical protein
MVEQGLIALRDIYTIRPGEPVFDNVAGTMQTAATDILKIRSMVGKKPVCCFFETSSSGCAVYDHRPYECRVLECWNPEPLMKVYQHDRLTREDLLANVEGLMELIQDHQDRCSYATVRSLALSIRREEKTASAQQQLMEMIRFDLSLREVTKERSGHDEPMMDFLFGQPLTETIRLFRLRLAKKDSGIVLEAFM